MPVCLLACLVSCAKTMNEQKTRNEEGATAVAFAQKSSLLFFFSFFLALVSSQLARRGWHKIDRDACSWRGVRVPGSYLTAAGIKPN